jgi:hypothetical protein
MSLSSSQSTWLAARNSASRGMSASDRIRLLKSKTLAVFKSVNPTLPDTANKGQSNETLILREVGTLNNCNGCTTTI